MLGNIWADIQNYFKDWLSRTGGVGAYALFEIDLSEARTDKIYQFSGDHVIITDCENQAYIKLNDKRNSLIDISVVREIQTPFNEFYITNAASSGNLKILVGSDGIFNCGNTQPIDITRCNIGNLPIDIKALTVGNLDIDISAQTIGNLDINLNAQDLDRLIIRDHDGGIESSGVSLIDCLTGGETDLYDSGASPAIKGTFRTAYFETNNTAGSHGIDPRLYIDETLIRPHNAFSLLNMLGFDTNTRPLQLLKYAENGYNVAIYNFEKGIVFDERVRLAVYNGSGSTVRVLSNYFYQKVA